MKTFRSLFLIASTCTLILFSCKKDEAANGPSPVPPAGDPTVSAVPLNGGSVTGRWTMTFDQVFTFRNDTLWDTDTATYPPGEFVMNFFANGTMNLMTGFDTASGTYSTSGNQLTLNLDQDIVVFTYGILNGNRMRWRIIETYTNGGDFYRDESDYLFDRY